MCLSTPPTLPPPSLTHTLTCTHTHAPYGCIITVREAALRNNYRGWLLLLFPTNKAVHKQDGGVGAGSSHHPPTQPPPHPTQSASRASFCCLHDGRNWVDTSVLHLHHHWVSANLPPRLPHLKRSSALIKTDLTSDWIDLIRGNLADLINFNVEAKWSLAKVYSCINRGSGQD